MSLSARSKKLFLTIGVVVWLGAVVWGLNLLNEYGFLPASSGAATDRWPVDAGMWRAEGIPTLVVALHPECTCSRASLSELDTILLETTPNLRAVVIFLDDDSEHPAGASPLFKTAQKMPGVTLVRDRDGSELKKFGFETSGDTRLYRADGTLIFRGGITLSRGHAGPNPGRDAVIHAVRDPQAVPAFPVQKTPVFGCTLFEPPTNS